MDPFEVELRGWPIKSEMQKFVDVGLHEGAGDVAHHHFAIFDGVDEAR
jgi:hypothetical protein